MNKQHSLFGIVLVFGYILCSVSAYLMVKHVFLVEPSISPINVMFWGSLGATILSGSFIGTQRRERQLVLNEWHTHKKLIIIISITSALGTLLWAWSLKLASAGSVGLIGRADIIIAILLGTIFLGERFSWKTILGTIIAIGGLFLVANIPSEISLFAIGIILLMRFLYTMQSFFVKKSGQNLRGISFTFLRLSIMTIFLFLLALTTKSLNMPSLFILILVILSKFFGAYIGRIFYFEAHKYWGIGHINLLSLAQPVLLLIGAWLLLNEPMPAQKLIGAAILMSGLFIIVLEKSSLNKRFSLKRIFATLRGKKDDFENPVDFR